MNCGLLCVLLDVLLITMFLVFNSTAGSVLPSDVSTETHEHLDITHKSLVVLLVSIHLIRYVLNPLVMAPLSESYGRKWVF